ncbi:MAG: hypothetical protein ACYSUP_11745 [Planctomycetota bacterium]|jgi:hypothetical protein
MIETHTELIPAPIGGLNYPQAGDEVAANEMTDCRNISVQDGLVQKRHGYKLFGGNLPLSGAIMGFDQYKKMSGATYLLAMTTKDIYRWNSSTGEWDIITERTALDSCDDDPITWIASANVTLARETTDIKEGDAALKVTIAAAFTTGQAVIREKAIGDITTYNFVRFWIKSSINLAAGALELVINPTGIIPVLEVSVYDSIGLADTPMANIDGLGTIVTEQIALADAAAVQITSPTILDAYCYDSVAVRDAPMIAEPLRTLSLPALTADTWTQVMLDLRILGVTSDLSNVGSIALRATSDFGACDILIDDFSAYDCFTGDDDDFFSFDHIRKIDQVDLWWCCSNGINPIKKYDGNTLGDLTADAPLANILREFKSYLFALDTVEGGDPMRQRARWPDTADPTNWLTGNAKYRDLSGSDWIEQALRYKGDYFVVLKSQSCWLGYASMDTDIFHFDQKVPEIGCAAGRTGVCLGEQIVFLGWDDFYMFDGIEAESLGSKIRKELFRILKTEEVGRAFGVQLDDDKEYWLHVVSTASDYCDIAWVLNRDLGCWTRHDFSDYFTAYGHYYIENSLRIGDLTMRIRDMNWKIGDRRLLSRTPTLLFGDKDGYTYEYSPVEVNDNGASIDAYFDTKDFILGGAEGRARIVRLDVYYTGGSLDIYYSKDKGKSWTLLTTLATSTSLEKPKIVRFRINTRQIRWRFRNAETGQTFSWQRAVMYYQRAGVKLLA